MKHAKVFKCGNSQAVRLPKEFQLHTSEVEVFKRDGDLVLREVPQNLARAFYLLCDLPDDFFREGRNDTPPQERDSF